MSTFMDFLTGGIGSVLPETVEATAPNVTASEPKADIASRLKQDLQRDFGLNDVQAAAFVGNLAHESGGFKSLQEIKPLIPGSRGGYGYAQWTGPRRRQFEGWTAEQGLDPSSYDANYGFLKHELSNTPEGRVLNSLRQANDPAAATQIVSDQFLRPGIPGMGSRQRWTQRVLGGDAIGEEGAPGQNQALAYAATRGRDPRANMPAPDATQAMGQMQMPSRQMPPDLSNSPDGGARDFMLRQAGMAPDMQPSGPQGGGGGQSLVQMLMGAVGGGGGQQQMRQPDSIESLIPDNKPNPFAFMGEALMENQQAAQKRQGQIFAAKQLVAQGMSPQDAVAAVSAPAIGQQLALNTLGQRRAAQEQAALRARLDGGQGGVASPAPVEAGGAPAAAQAQPALAAAPTEPTPAARISTGNKTVDTLFAQRSAKVLELAKTLKEPTTANTEGIIKNRAEALKAEIGNIDKRMEQYAPTGTIKEYTFAMAQRQEQGLPVISLEAFDAEQRKAGAANVNVKNEGSIPPGYQIERDAQGNPSRMVAIPGGPADTEAKQKAEKEKLGREQTKASATVVLDALDDIDRLMKTAKLPTTGALGSRLASVGGTAASDIASTLKTVRANISFDKLSEMRAASATGAALGAVSDTEMALLANSAAALEQSQSEAQFKTNLKRLRDRFDTIVNGPRANAGGEPKKADEAIPKAFTKADYDKLEAGTEYQDAEGNIRRKGGK